MIDYNENRYSMKKTTAGSEYDDDGGADLVNTGGNLRMKDIQNFHQDVRGSVCVKARKPSVYCLKDFELKTQLGRGTFGKVFLAELKQTGKLYAIKTIRKDVLIERE